MKAHISNPNTKALLYCRVSSKKQANEASGLESQEHRCRAYAAELGIAVEAVFPDDVSGGGDFMKRPGMVSLLRYLDRQRSGDYVVIFDDLKRFARDTEFHLRLRREFETRGARIECLNFRFEDTPEGKFVETVFAAQGQLEREQNTRQVVQKMKARVEQGYWVFRAPVGYKYVKADHGGKVLVRDEPLASIVQDALEGFATGRLSSQAEVRRFLERQPLFPKDKPNGELRPMTITCFLNKAVYAGYVSAPSWGIPLRPGRHDALISLASYERIQERLSDTGHAPKRADIHEDFPLRGAVACSSCQTPLTGGWSKGKYKRYAYYFCRTKGCADYGKSIPRAKLESRFEALLAGLRPKGKFFDIATMMLKDAWADRENHVTELAKTRRAEAKDVEQEIEKLITLVVEARNPRVVKAYEDRIDELERRKLLLLEEIGKDTNSEDVFDRVFELSMNFLSDPQKLWNSGAFEHKRAVLKLAFSDFLTHDRDTGILNSKTSLPFKVLESFCDLKKEMVPPGRLELPLPKKTDFESAASTNSATGASTA